MNERVRMEIAAIAADTESGATAVLERALGVLRGTAHDRAALESVADELCRAQPSMAGLRVAAAIARRAEDPLAAIDEFRARVARAPHAIARHAAALLRLRRGTGAVRLVTCSRSRAVELAIRQLAEVEEVEVACAESRPALEGRELAVSLAAGGVTVTVYSDAGIATAVAASDALLVGADAIGPDTFINKAGTSALAALAAAEGVPTYVLAGREKILPAAVFDELVLRAGSLSELWDSAPQTIRLANPYFERIRTAVVAAFVTEGGVAPCDGIVELSLV